MWITAASWAATLAEKEAAARERYRSRGDAAAQAILLDEHGPLLQQLKVEAPGLKEVHKVEAARNKAGPSMYGDPFATGNKPRRRFWPKAKETMPLFFLLAWLVLGIPAASTKNERMHSVSGRICSKFRACMKPSTLEHLTLGYY